MSEPHSADAGVTDTPYTSTLLRYYTQLQIAANLITTMRDMPNALHEYIPASERPNLPILVTAAKIRHAKLSLELNKLIDLVSGIINNAIDRPNRIYNAGYDFKYSSTAGALRMMQSEMTELKHMADKLGVIYKATLRNVDLALERFAKEWPEETDQDSDTSSSLQLIEEDLAKSLEMTEAGSGLTS